MLTINGYPKQVCSGLTRREALQIGGAGLFGLSLPGVLAAEEVAGAFQNGRAKSVIFLYLFGGPSQLESFDMKPEASSSIRGPFSPIHSRTPGLQISEHLSRTANISDKICVIRTMTHPHNDHNACHYMQTGHKWTRSAADGGDVNARSTDWPAMGSVVEYLSRSAPDAHKRELPDYIYLPNKLGALQGYERTGQHAGWLGSAYNAFATNIRKRNSADNPYFRSCNDEELDFRIHGMATTKAITLDRLNRRSSLLKQFDQANKSFHKDHIYENYDRIQQRALSLVTSTKMRSAFDITKESAALRDRYGRHLFGQSALMGRRMVEAGARFVTVCWDAPDGYSWDSHIHSNHLEKHLLPGFDQTYTALITDLEERGLLDETLVVAVGEMGRTPKGTASWGRGHWSHCFPCLLAGAGIRGGILHGTSDAEAAYPAENPVSPEDLAKTIYWSLGIDPDLFLMDREDRPIPIIESGQPLKQLFG
ncbi:MAG: DUF1501 domain-containing protein [Planctomycetes bacterium]|nr:DUF1501 domain-containing protein [Planctomycetota bacterium]MCH9726157.1 DUF1501 domain-containing protein [Planctomycetota bacterium]MCH9775663.1 DUF1501 domain-containing protein [Planctomycetota bacterium]MCH9792029.1 DUF1501 domain-containing protein [Planctomycetota bacterium]MDF1744252.1 DUF1501 domain-containing protein [Gimesia sp.]